MLVSLVVCLFDGLVVCGLCLVVPYHHSSVRSGTYSHLLDLWHVTADRSNCVSTLVAFLLETASLFAYLETTYHHLARFA